MDVFSLFSDRKQKLGQLKEMRRPSTRFSQSPSDKVAYITCPACKHEALRGILKKSLYVCERCGQHLKLSGRRRLRLTFDGGQFTELFDDIRPRNPIDFPEYEEKLAALTEKTGLADACLCGEGTIGGSRAVAAVLDSAFLMGSMGTAVGDKVACAAEYALEKRLPLIVFSASGGARMQEGIFSLMQMAKTSAAIKRFSDAGGLFISYLTNPTTGGVTASFAMLGDIILAEPGALIGFAGPRVIEQTIKAKLPEGFQRAEFQQDHGFVDAIVSRKDMKDTLARLLSLHKREGWS